MLGYVLPVALLSCLLCGATSFSAFPNGCSEDLKNKSTVILGSKKFTFPKSYKVHAIFTDWISKTTVDIIEIRTEKGARALQLTSQSLAVTRFLLFQDKFVLINGSECTAKEAQPFSLPEELKTLNLSSASVFDFFDSLIKKNFSGALNGEGVVSGVQGVSWLSCQNSTGDKSSPGISVNVVFAGELSPRPISILPNPQFLSLTLTSYDDIWSVNATEKAGVSIEIVSVEEAYDTDSLFVVPDGVLCPSTGVALPIKLPTTFTARVLTTEDKKGFLSEIVYDATGKYSSDHGLVGPPGRVFNESVPADSAVIVHDFTHGYEYVLGGGDSQCVVSTLPSSSRDFADNALVAPEKLLFPDTQFTQYQDKVFLGKTSKSFRGKSGEDVVEVVDGTTAFAVSTHRAGVLVSSSLLSIVETSVVSVPSACFNASSNSSFSLSLVDKTMSSVRSMGVRVVEDSLSAAFASLAPLTSHRLSFFFEETDKSLRVLFSLADPPLAASLFNTTEVSTSYFINKLNSTIQADDLKFNVTRGGKTELWRLEKGSLSPVGGSVPPPPSFTGYSGGSMFVLAVFMLLFGVLIGAGGVFFVTRRQSISTFAYQVFE